MIVHAKIHAHQIAIIMEIVDVMVLAHVMDILEMHVKHKIHVATQLVLHVKKIQIVDGVLITMFVKTNIFHHNRDVLKQKKTFATTCPNSKLQTAVTSVTENQTTTIAVVVVAVLLLLLAIVALVIYMRKKKETNDFLLTGMMTTDNIGNNPLFKDKEVGGDNPFYAHPDNNQDISRANVHDK